MKKSHARIAGGGAQETGEDNSFGGCWSTRCGGQDWVLGFRLSKLSASVEKPLMPYVDSPGAAINHRGEYGSFMAEPAEDFRSPRDCVLSRDQQWSR